MEKRIRHDAIETISTPEPFPRQSFTDAGEAVAALGYRDWYLFTERHEEYYAKFGWILLERRELHGQTVALMVQELT